MTQDSDDFKKLRLLIERQEAEATLHWNRNSYFLIVMSILMVAFSQSPAPNQFQRQIQILIASGGVALSVIWLLIQHRSSKYILYYKTEAQKLVESTKIIDVYPKELGGIEIRKLAYSLPIVFLVVWIAFIVLIVLSFF